MPHRLKHALLTFAALVFLVEAWLWDLTISLGRWVVGLLPWVEFKAAVVRQIERLPPYGALPLFLIPLAVVEPLKFVAIHQIAHGHLFRGLLALVALKFVGVAVTAFVFDLTRAKLLSIGWFARFYAWVVKWRNIAHNYIEPYKEALRARIAELKLRVWDLKRRFELPAGRSGIVEALLRVRARVRKARD